MKTLRLAFFTLVASLAGYQMAWSMEDNPLRQRLLGQTQMQKIEAQKLELQKKLREQQKQEDKRLENLRQQNAQQQKLKIHQLEQKKLEQAILKQQQQEEARMQQMNEVYAELEGALNKLEAGEALTPYDKQLIADFEKNEQSQKQKTNPLREQLAEQWGRGKAWWNTPKAQPEEEKEEEEQEEFGSGGFSFWGTQPKSEQWTSVQRGKNKDKDLAEELEYEQKRKARGLSFGERAAQTRGQIQSTTKQIKEIHNLTKGVAEDLGAAAKATKAVYNAVHKKLHKAGPGFEIANKSQDPIWAAIAVGRKVMPGKSGKGYYFLPSGQRLPLNVDLRLPITIGVYTDKPAATSKITQARFFPLHHQFISTDRKQPSLTFFTDNAAMGKTKYFTWNPGHGQQPLYPQTGEWGGVRKLSSSGFSLLNNIKPYEITQAEPEEEEDDEEEEY